MRTERVEYIRELLAAVSTSHQADQKKRKAVWGHSRQTRRLLCRHHEEGGRGAAAGSAAASVVEARRHEGAEEAFTPVFEHVGRVARDHAGQPQLHLVT